MNPFESHLKLGLIALSRTTKFGSWFYGHIGAEILTNTFFLIEFELSSQLENAIRARIKFVISKHNKFFDSASLDEKGNDSTLEIEKNLKDNLSNLSTAGHGIIYSTLALKAIKALNGWLPTGVKNGLIELQLNAQKDMPNRYLGYHDYQNSTIDLSDIPVFKNAQEAAKYCLKNQTIFKNQEIEGEHYFFQGNQLHDITHSQALIMLNQMGYNDLSTLGLEQLRKQIKLGKSQPPKGIQAVSNNFYDPFDASFWERPVEDEHHFKLAYSVAFLLNNMSEIDRNSTLTTLAPHWDLMD